MKSFISIFLFVVASTHAIADTTFNCTPVVSVLKRVAHNIEFTKSSTDMYATLDGGEKSMCHRIAVPLSSVRQIEGHQVGQWATCGALPFLDGPWIGDDHPGFYTSYHGIDYACYAQQ